MKILIIQSSPRPAPSWIRECQHTVELWCEFNRYEYIHYGDELFNLTAEYGAPFTKIQRSDLARLRLLTAHLSTGPYDAVYWLDSDFLIWNIYSFKLPVPTPGSVVCAREGFCFLRDTVISLNNSVLGFCSAADARVLADLTQRALDDWPDRITVPPHTIAGPMVLTKFRFPLRRIIAKQAGCFSENTIKRILGPYHSGRRHLRHLSMISGETLAGANLCSSRQLDELVMRSLIADLIHGDDLELGGWKYASGIYRGLCWVRSLPFRVKCWLQTRVERMRKSLSPARS